jgi:MFS transporter, DHA1 family, multidrug resistance protein
MDIEKHLALGASHSRATTPLRPSFDRNLSRESSGDTRKEELFSGHDEQPNRLQFGNPSSSGSSISEDSDVEKGPDVVETPHAPQASRSKDPNLVDWDGPSDPDNPQNWSLTKKWYITMILSCLAFSITFSSSIFSQATVTIAELYSVSTEVTTLATSLFVLVCSRIGLNIHLTCFQLIGC